jgi:transcriptional regulator with XRE-family HTH domain
MTSQQQDPGASSHAWRVVEAALKRRGWSVAQLARRAELNDKTIRRLKQGLGSEPATLHKIADALEMPYTTLAPVEQLNDYVPQLDQLSRQLEQIDDRVTRLLAVVRLIAEKHSIALDDQLAEQVAQETSDAVRQARKDRDTSASDEASRRASDQSR